MIREALGKAAEQALRAGDIIRRLRDFVTRRESDKTIVRIARLLEEASALALVGARELGVMVRFQIAPTVTNVLVDAVQIQQVLVNLLRNALEAMQESVRRELLSWLRSRQTSWSKSWYPIRVMACRRNFCRSSSNPS